MSEANLPITAPRLPDRLVDLIDYSQPVDGSAPLVVLLETKWQDTDIKSKNGLPVVRGGASMNRVYGLAVWLPMGPLWVKGDIGWDVTTRPIVRDEDRGHRGNFWSNYAYSGITREGYEIHVQAGRGSFRYRISNMSSGYHVVYLDCSNLSLEGREHRAMSMCRPAHPECRYSLEWT